MSWISHMLGTDYQAPAQSQPLNTFLAGLQDPNYGQAQLGQYAQSAVANALPSFMQNMQGTKENNIARGISTGDLGTSFEGDLTSAFQRNIANSVSGQAMNLLSDRNHMLMGGYEDQLDREQAAQNNASQRKSGLINSLIGGAANLFGRSGGGAGGGSGGGLSTERGYY